MRKFEQQPTTDEQAKEVLATVRPVNAPILNASMMQMTGTGNEFVVTLSRVLPTQDSATGELTNAMMAEVVGVLVMSPQTAKDFWQILKLQIERHEKEHGEIISPFTKQSKT
jgi:hypothetical protein